MKKAEGEVDLSEWELGVDLDALQNPIETLVLKYAAVALECMIRDADYYMRFSDEQSADPLMLHLRLGLSSDVGENPELECSIPLAVDLYIESVVCGGSGKVDEGERERAEAIRSRFMDMVRQLDAILPTTNERGDT